jgi:hypothetical protein
VVHPEIGAPVTADDDLPVVSARRRVNPLWVVGAAAVVGVITIALVVGLPVLRNPEPTSPPAAQGLATTPTTSAPVRVSASSQPTASGPATTAASTTSNPGAAPPGGGGSAGGGGAQPPNQDVLDGCLRRASVTSVFDAGWVSVKWNDHETCPPNAYARVFWVSYYMLADGTGVSYATETYRLDDATPAARFHISWPASCETWFVVVGPVAVKDTLTAAQMNGQVAAYPGTGPWAGGPNDSIHSDIDSDCEPV